MMNFPIRKAGLIIGTTQVDDDVDLRGKRLTLNGDGYVQFTYNGKNTMLHTHVLNLKVGDGLEADHKDFDKKNNKRDNLRLATRQQNIHHFPLTKRNKTGLRGIYKTRGGTYVPQIQSKVDGKHRCNYLGTFETAEAAGRAYDDVARLRGEYQPLNFPLSTITSVIDLD